MKLILYSFFLPLTSIFLVIVSSGEVDASNEDGALLRRELGGCECDDHHDCPSDRWCGDCKCHRKRPEGSQCNRDYKCESKICSHRKCVSSSGGGGPEYECTKDRHCGNHAYCKNYYCYNYECSKDNDCGKGNHCENYHCIADDDPECSKDRDCDPGYCDKGHCAYSCRKDRHCYSHWCDHRQCRSLKALGEHCRRSYECESGYCDNGILFWWRSYTCVPNYYEGRNGEYCTDDDQCRSHWCKKNQCHAWH